MKVNELFSSNRENVPTQGPKPRGAARPGCGESAGGGVQTRLRAERRTCAACSVLADVSKSLTRSLLPATRNGRDNADTGHHVCCTQLGVAGCLHRTDVSPQ